MKTKVVALIASGLFGAGIWGYSQQMGPQNMSGCPWMTQAQVQQVRNHPMMGWYMHMGQLSRQPYEHCCIAKSAGTLRRPDQAADIDPRKI
jgi:hypothetical protein